jgi:hypothetical protein
MFDVYDYIVLGLFVIVLIVLIGEVRYALKERARTKKWENH